MAVTKKALVFIICISAFSVLLGSVINILNHNVESNKGNTSKSIGISDTEHHLIWFLQISDIHISIFQDPLRITEFREFCENTVNTILPSAVLATGDLTDAKTKDSYGSQQFENEWKHYYEVLQTTKITQKTNWLDIRGNHDNFNVLNKFSKENYYRHYSIQGQNYPRSYHTQIKKGSDLYSFIGVDACTEPGPKRPFNFVGIIDQMEIENIQKLIADTESSDYVVWFGHYPTSCILSESSQGIRDLIGQVGTVYLCGHLHTLGGLVPNMYTMQRAGFLELELADWKDNRMYRLMAIDHGFLSFTDVKHREWPLILITNPKHALFVIPHKEDMENVRRSTHVRILVFSLAEIETVNVKIDDEEWRKCRKVKGPLYVSQWSPQLYLNGLHTIEVWVKDHDGREKYISQSFSLDYTRLSFDLLPRIALMSNANQVFKIMFFVALTITILPLYILRRLHRLVVTQQMQTPRLHRGWFRRWVRKLWILSTIDRMFWPLVLYPLYLTIGPWSIGYIIENHLGIIFAWGIYTDGMYIPGSLTYGYGFLHIPFTLILANGVDHRFEYQVLKPECQKSALKQLSVHLPFIILVGIQISMSYFFWLAFGTMAFLLGPLRTWSVLLALILWHQALILPEKCTRQAAKVWTKS